MRMAPGEELPDQILRDRVPEGETGQQALAEEFHDRVSVPRLERVKDAVIREHAVGREDVSMRMPLQKVTSAGDRDHDAGPCVRSGLCSHELGEGLRAALRQVEQKLPPLPEDPAKEARHGEDDMTMRDGLVGPDARE
jgi:hypothetical protein